jgi:DNA helicase HerA-like ATPase
VVVDTSKVGDEAELLIGSMIANRMFTIYQDYKAEGTLDGKLPVSIVIEEAPRVLSSDRLVLGENEYSKIAREGRKFKIGLVAITQLTSVIPRDILTNINTKIILGNEMATERRAIIDSAAQDLSDDDRTIASLDRGEAIVTSIFTKFAIPIQIPLFEEYAKAHSASAHSSLPSKLQYKG